VPTRTNLGNLYMATDRVNEAVDQLTSVLALRSGSGDVLARLKASILLAGAHRRAGELDLAVRGLHGAVELAERTGHQELQATASNPLGEVLAEHDRS
jgi:hypothetical protein